ncbi:exodeoxyribonuclease VII small subunit [Candidatus Halobeggiatoa sp. HSG11]|nr:exodeoxyribonuclease VII small subunit [Candidatus Halobeggiatoa sp. HSG11]
MPTADSYLKNYRKLKKIADTMREQQNLDVDQLVKMVDEATVAYKKCQTRIEAVEKALGLES